MTSPNNTNLRLGDIKEYDCTLGYRQSGVTVQWKKYNPTFTLVNTLNNPLILTVNQSINNTFYKCIVTIANNNLSPCPVQQVNVSVTVKGILNKNVHLLPFNRYIYNKSDD